MSRIGAARGSEARILKHYPLDPKAKKYWAQNKRVQEIKKAFFDGECGLEDVIGSLVLLGYVNKIAYELASKWDYDKQNGVAYEEPK